MSQITLQNRTKVPLTIKAERPPNSTATHKRTRNVERVIEQICHGTGPTNNRTAQACGWSDSARCRLTKLHCMRSNADLLQQVQQPPTKVPLTKEVEGPQHSTATHKRTRNVERVIEQICHGVGRTKVPLTKEVEGPQHSTAQHSTAQHSTAQHSTAQHSTAQHSTAQHSTLFTFK